MSKDMTELKKTHEDYMNEYFTSYYKGQPVRFTRNRWTNETLINADDVVRICGISGSFEEYLSTDAGLDFINDWKKDHPNAAFFGGAVKMNKK